MEASNVKAMREALKEIHQMGIDLRNIIPHLDKRWEVHLKTAINIYQTAERAYLAPPRNCDRPECQTTREAARVWRLEDGGKTAYHEWLLAPATEQKGETNGRS